jgi:hypothetical protein
MLARALKFRLIPFAAMIVVFLIIFIILIVMLVINLTIIIIISIIIFPFEMMIDFIFNYPRPVN